MSRAYGIVPVWERASRFYRGPPVRVEGRELAHAPPPGSVDVRVTQKTIPERGKELRAKPTVRLRPPSRSDWNEVVVRVPVHEANLEEFIVMAVDDQQASLS
jgi:hypothetical protein